MPKVDTETLFSVCVGDSTGRKTHPADDHESETHPDFPPESIYLSKDEEYDWIDRNAVYERKESTKGNSNSNPNSRQFSSKFKAKASIIGLPKLQKYSFVEARKRLRRSCSSTPLFPKGSTSVMKLDSSPKEPSSPKVTWTGKIRYMRDRNRRLRNSRRSNNSEPVRTERKHCFFKSFVAIFRCGLEKKPVVELASTKRK